jgi:predicted nucleic acid-binding Zn ribbon protein
MTYLYECPNCHCEEDVVKNVSEIDRAEVCVDCGIPMQRQICRPAACVVDNFKSEHYWTFGRVVNSKHDLKNELARYKGETGSELVEIGSDKMPKIKRKKTEY